MKKLLLTALLSISVSATYFAQTVLFSENFETGGGSISLNTSDLSSNAGTSGSNYWVINNDYTGGSGTLICLGFPFSFSVTNSASQPAGITGAPNSSYMHIVSSAAVSSGINCSSFQAADGVCTIDENNFSEMSADISTIGFTSVTFDFWWMCGGSATIYGELYYSTDGGTTWTLEQGLLNNQATWTQGSYVNPMWDNQASLRFGFRFVNTTTGTATDPGFSVDDIEITGTPGGGGTNDITTGTGLTPTSWCVGNATTLQVDFTSTGTFNSGNVYSAELSDASGSFAAPTVVGTLASTANSGIVTAVIPGSTPVGNAYRIRVVSDNPATVGTDNGTDLSITSLPTVTQQSFSDVCLSGGAVNLTGASPAGGTYSGTGVSGSTFDPSVSGQGTFPITYTYTNGNGCTNTAVEPITVTQGPSVTQSPFSDVCSSGGVITLVGGAPAGGTYSGAGVTGSQFDPSVAGLGSFPITYTYTDAGGCSGSAVETITVVQGPAVTLDPFTPVCNTDPFFTLTGGTPSNGTYTGPGVTGGVFDPSVAGVGNHTITYTFTDANGCSGTANQTIQVDICGSIGEIAQVNFTVYPNPVENTFTVESEGIIEGVALADLSGRWIKEFDTNSTIYQVEEVPAGVYLLHVVVDGKRQTRRLVIR